MEMQPEAREKEVISLFELLSDNFDEQTECIFIDSIKDIYRPQDTNRKTLFYERKLIEMVLAYSNQWISGFAAILLCEHGYLSAEGYYILKNNFRHIEWCERNNPDSTEDIAPMIKQLLKDIEKLQHIKN